MIEKTLEIRGINRKTLMDYLHSLGAKRTKEDPPTYVAKNWSAKLSDEQYFHLFHSNIPKVFVTFFAEDEESLEDVVSRFRLKTFRVGG